MDQAQSSGPLEGYSRLAAWMEKNPDVAIFRRFGHLNLQNLLYLQSELINLNQDYQRIAQVDSSSGDTERKQFSKQWIKLARSSSCPQQWEKWLEIWAKLEQYSKNVTDIQPGVHKLLTYLIIDHAILQTSQLYQHSAPPNPQLTALKAWLDDPREGKCFLRGQEVNTWEQENEADLISLADDACQQDPFTQWVANYPLNLFHRHIGERIFSDKQSGDEEKGFICYSDVKIARFSAGLGTALGSALTMTSIIVLYYINRTVLRLVAISIFMFLFSLLLSIFTRARKIEIFAATCA